MSRLAVQYSRGGAGFVEDALTRLAAVIAELLLIGHRDQESHNILASLTYSGG